MFSPLILMTFDYEAFLSLQSEHVMQEQSETTHRWKREAHFPMRVHVKVGPACVLLLPSPQKVTVKSLEEIKSPLLFSLFVPFAPHSLP